MRLHEARRGSPRRRGRNPRALSAVVLALFLAFALWPCCEVMAGSVPLSGGAPGHHDGGEQHGPDHAPGPCAWMDAGGIALPEPAPAAGSGFDAAHPALYVREPHAGIARSAAPHTGSSPGPPGPIYLGLLRLRL